MTGDSFLRSRIKIEGLHGRMLKFLRGKEPRDLPSTSQIYRLREAAITGDIGAVKGFISSREKKKKASRSWGGQIQGMRIDQWILERIIKPFQTKDVGLSDFTNSLKKSLCESVTIANEELISEEEAKKALFREFILRFIDELILFKDGCNYEIVPDGQGKKVEVKCHG